MKPSGLTYSLRVHTFAQGVQGRVYALENASNKDQFEVEMRAATRRKLGDELDRQPWR